MPRLVAPVCKSCVGNLRDADGADKKQNAFQRLIALRAAAVSASRNPFPVLGPKDSSTEIS